MDSNGEGERRTSPIGYERLLDELGELAGNELELSVIADQRPARVLSTARGRLSLGPELRLGDDVLTVAWVGGVQLALKGAWIAGAWHDPTRGWLAIEFHGGVLVELEPPGDHTDRL